jgi:hypothetical protein
MVEISPLRRRMIEDMTVRDLSPPTQRFYLNAVSKFSRYFWSLPRSSGPTPSRFIWGRQETHGHRRTRRLCISVLLWRDARPSRRAGIHRICT